MIRRIPLLALLILGAVEVGAVVFAAIPNVGDDYRAFYLDRSTWCLELDPSGDYDLGATISLARGAGDAFNRIHRCGFGVAVRDGAWLKGDLARLEAKLSANAGALDFSFELTPASDRNWPLVRLRVKANGADLSMIEVADTGTHVVHIPADVVAASPNRLHLELTVDDTRVNKTKPLDHQRDTIRFHWMRLSSAADP